MSLLNWGFEETPLFFDLSDDSPVTSSLFPRAGKNKEIPDQALVEILTVEDGHGLTNTRINRTAIGDSLRYSSHEISESTLMIQQSTATGVVVTSKIDCGPRPGIYRSTTKVQNDSLAPIHLQAVSTLCLGGINGLLGPREELDVWSASSEWCAESRWFATPLMSQEAIPDINTHIHDQAGRGTFARSSSSTWSSGKHLPMGAISNREDGNTLIWQIEHNGPWIWEVNSQFDKDNWVSLSLSGPTDLQHSWLHVLAPGETFTSVSASLAVASSFDEAFALLTKQRRDSRHVLAATNSRGLVFNDYMNTLMGDPTTEKLLPLIDAAASVGVEYFVIDAGWYDNDQGDWWPSVGEWMPAEKRFGVGGFEKVMDHIRANGMKPGLWLEPEVIGVRSAAASFLPDGAFMTRMDVRIREHDRYFLDLRTKAAQDHLDSVFDRVLGQYGVKFIKWDYNVTPGVGPDANATSPGEALLDHCRSYLTWFERLRSRYPDVTFEACSSGAMRQDPLTTSRYDLQSTSDQQDFLLYAPIAAAAPTIIAPEQAGNWAYPHAGMTQEEISFCLINGLAGRMYLSGYLNKMSKDQLELIREATSIYPRIIAHNAQALPRWPLGLPKWDADTLCLGLQSEKKLLLFLWKRSHTGATFEIPLPELQDKGIEIETVFPSRIRSWNQSWDSTTGLLTITANEEGPAARIISVTLK